MAWMFHFATLKLLFRTSVARTALQINLITLSQTEGSCMTYAFWVSSLLLQSTPPAALT